MATLSLADLAGAPGGTVLSEGLRPVVDAARTTAFEDAMGRTGAVPTPVADAATVSADRPDAVARQEAVAPQEGSAARERVRRTLDLEGVATRPTEGDAILGGLQRLRGTFDGRHSRIGTLMEGNAVNTNALLAMQMEVAQYTLLVDVSSKLTGKATQSLDTLMKGQ